MSQNYFTQRMTHRRDEYLESFEELPFQMVEVTRRPRRVYDKVIASAQWRRADAHSLRHFHPGRSKK